MFNEIGEKRLRIYKSCCFVVAIILIMLEGVVLFQARKYLPGGIAPASITSIPNELITGKSGRDWIIYDPGSFAEVHNAIEQDVEDIQDYSEDELPTVLRDWTVNLQGSGAQIDMNLADPREVLHKFRNGKCACCTQLAILYVAALNSFEIPARRVELFVCPGNYDKAHSTVEVWNGHKWIIQDPTFNSIALDKSGEMLSVTEIRENYEDGEEVIWVQDATITEPDFDSYQVSPDRLFKITVYRLYEYPLGKSQWELRFMRLTDRLTGQTQSIVLTSEAFPLSEFVASGKVDRMILILALIFLLLAIVPFPRRFYLKITRSQNPSGTL